MSHFRRLDADQVKKFKKGFDTDFIILHSTDFTQIKRTDFLIKELSLIQEKIGNFRLLITNTMENEKEKNKLLDLAKNC